MVRTEEKEMNVNLGTIIFSEQERFTIGDYFTGTTGTGRIASRNEVRDWVLNIINIALLDDAVYESLTSHPFFRQDLSKSLKGRRRKR